MRQREPAADAGTDAGEAVTLKWAIWDKDTTPYWQALKDAYEAANPNVTLEMVDLGSADYMTVLATELSGSGSDFDVVTIKDVPGYATLVSKNTLEPLDSYISAKRNRFEPVRRRGCADYCKRKSLRTSFQK